MFSLLPEQRFATQSLGFFLYNCRRLQPPLLRELTRYELPVFSMVKKTMMCGAHSRRVFQDIRSTIG